MQQMEALVKISWMTFYLFLSTTAQTVESLPLGGKIAIQNNSSCSINPLYLITPGQEDFDLSDNKNDNENLELTISYSGSRNTTKHYFVPLSIECSSELYNSISYTKDIEVTAANNRLEISISSDIFPYPPMQLIIAGQSYIDENNRAITLIAQPTSFGTGKKTS